MRRIANVAAVEPYVLDVTWKDGETDRIDMAGVILGLDLFSPLRDFDAFTAVEAIDWGTGIQWRNGLDYSSSSLAVLADEQREIANIERPPIC